MRIPAEFRLNTDRVQISLGLHRFRADFQGRSLTNLFAHLLANAT